MLYQSYTIQLQTQVINVATGGRQCTVQCTCATQLGAIIVHNVYIYIGTSLLVQ